VLEQKKPAVSLLPTLSSAQAPTTAWHPSIKIEKTFRFHYIQYKTVACSLHKNPFHPFHPFHPVRSAMLFYMSGWSLKSKV
jgi:hypothetical protein